MGLQRHNLTAADLRDAHELALHVTHNKPLRSLWREGRQGGGPDLTRVVMRWAMACAKRLGAVDIKWIASRVWGEPIPPGGVAAAQKTYQEALAAYPWFCGVMKRLVGQGGNGQAGKAEFALLSYFENPGQGRVAGQLGVTQQAVSRLLSRMDKRLPRSGFDRKQLMGSTKRAAYQPKPVDPRDTVGSIDLRYVYVGPRQEKPVKAARAQVKDKLFDRNELYLEGPGNNERPLTRVGRDPDAVRAELKISKKLDEPKSSENLWLEMLIPE